MKRKRNQHKPIRHPRCRHWHASSRHAVPLSLRSVCLSLYRASLPMMTPMTKKSTQNARTRAPRPSSLMVEVAIPEEEEWGAPIEVTFLFRSPSSSWMERERAESERGREESSEQETTRIQTVDASSQQVHIPLRLFEMLLSDWILTERRAQEGAEHFLIYNIW